MVDRTRAPRGASIPKGCSPVQKPGFLNDLTLALSEHEAALCVFNPNGEVLADKEILAESMAYHAEHSLPPLDSWSSIRLFTVDEEQALMDIVDCRQLDIPDHEVLFPKADFEPGETDVFIRNTTLYLLENGDVIEDGDTMDGPGGAAIQGWRRHHRRQRCTSSAGGLFVGLRRMRAR